MKSLSDKVGGMLCHCGSTNKYMKLDEKLERKMIEFKRRASGHSNFKTLDSIIIKFPHFREGLRNLRTIFHQYDEDSNGSIDHEELKKCLEKLQVHLTEEEVEDLFSSCDIDGSEGIQFNEFIVLLCLIYLLMKPLSTADNVLIFISILFGFLSSECNKCTGKTSSLVSFMLTWGLFQASNMGPADIEATFDTIVEAFTFLDKNGDGKLNKKDVVKALNESSPWEKSPVHVTNNRFEEMDWDKNGKVSFREFLFAFISWVGIDSEEEAAVSGS